MYILPIDIARFPKIHCFYLERELLNADNMFLVEIISDSSTKECTCIAYMSDEYGDGDAVIYHNQYTLISKETDQEINTTSTQDFREKLISQEYELTECDSLIWNEDTGFLRAVIYQAVITIKREENLNADFYLCSYDKEEYLSDVKLEVLQKWLILHNDYRPAYPYTYATDQGKSVFSDKMMGYFKQKYYPSKKETLLGVVKISYEIDFDDEFILCLIKEKTEYDPSYIELSEAIEDGGIDTLDIPELNQLLEELYFDCMDSSGFDVHVSSVKILTPWINGLGSFGIRANLELLFKSGLTEKLHFNRDNDKDCDIYDLCKAAVIGPSILNANGLILFEKETYPNIENKCLKDIEDAIKRDINCLYDIPSLCEEHIRMEKLDLQSIIIEENAAENLVK